MEKENFFIPDGFGSSLTTILAIELKKRLKKQETFFFHWQTSKIGY